MQREICRYWGYNMWTENKVFKKDLAYICSADFVAWDKLENSTVFITGATGLIGYTLTCALLYRNIKFNSNIKILALVRDIEKARKRFATQLIEGCGISFIKGNLESIPVIDGDIDYIIHGAAPTASAYFVSNPVETINDIVVGTSNLLKLARQKDIKSFLYMSSMEVYGAPHSDDLLKEEIGTTLNTMAIRSCYPEAKRMSEALCAAYSNEYNVPTKVIRLAQTFGVGVQMDDNRVFAEFARCAVNGHNIVLQTKGDSKRVYLYTADAVTAILVVLLLGKNGEAYNAGNESTYCSIKEMAEMVADKIANSKIEVLIKINEKSKQKFSPSHRLKLDVSKLRSLGWRPSIGLEDMYKSVLGKD